MQAEILSQDEKMRLILSCKWEKKQPNKYVC